MRFLKMQGLGNDFIVVDGESDPVTATPEGLVRTICDRRFGVGADGFVVISRSAAADARMGIWNADGSRADMCGNALRCVAEYLESRDGVRPATWRIETDQGILDAERAKGADGLSAWRVAAGRPHFDRARIPMLGLPGRVLDEPFEAAGRTWPLCALFLGNPHAVIFGRDIDSLDLDTIGPAFENHERFPRRINVSFVEVLSRTEVRQRTWERGVGETLACGTGASAVCAAGILTGRTGRRVTDHLRGGDLVLEWAGDDEPVTMVGPAKAVFEGRWS